MERKTPEEIASRRERLREFLKKYTFKNNVEGTVAFELHDRGAPLHLLFEFPDRRFYGSRKSPFTKKDYRKAVDEIFIDYGVRPLNGNWCEGLSSVSTFDGLVRYFRRHKRHEDAEVLRETRNFYNDIFGPRSRKKVL